MKVFDSHAYFCRPWHSLRMNKANGHAHNTNYSTQFPSGQFPSLRLGRGLHGDEAKLLLTPTYFESLTVESLTAESLTVETLMIESLTAVSNRLRLQH